MPEGDIETFHQAGMWHNKVEGASVVQGAHRTRDRDCLQRIMKGEIVILAGDHETSVGGVGDWPGRSAGLSPREAEINALITQV